MNKNKNSNKSPQRGNVQNTNTTKKRRRGKKSKNNHRDDINHNPINNNKNMSKSTSNAKSNSAGGGAPKLSYAARISSASSKPSKKSSSLRIRSGSGGRQYETTGSPRQSLHGNISREDLLRIRMQQRDICYVAGLPKSICTRAILGSKKWFGQFGKIRDITITDNQNCIRTNWMCVHIKYFENISALRAVQAMNHKKLDDGRVLEANYGTQRYCEFFINNKKCHKSNCPFRHSWCKLNEIVKFNNHHQIVSNQNQNHNQVQVQIQTQRIQSPKQQHHQQPQQQQVPLQPQQTQSSSSSTTSPQPQSIRPQAVIISQQSTSDNAVHSVASTSSADLKQNDINIGSDKNDENMISIGADYGVSDNNDENEETQMHLQQQEEPGASHKDSAEDEAPHEVQMHEVHEGHSSNNNVNNIVHEQQVEMRELYQELQCVKEENKTQKLQLMEFQRQINAKDAEIVKLQKISRRLYDAHSRLKSENDVLQKQNNDLIQEINKNKTQSLDLLDYTLWTWHDVFQWIISIENGKFQKYKDVLQVNLKLENIDGSCIKCLSTNDIHRIGIVDYKDKQLILECIANLKSNLGLDNLISDIINTDTHCINVNVNTNHPPHIV